MLTLTLVLIFLSLSTSSANESDEMFHLLKRVENIEKSGRKQNLVVKEQAKQIRQLKLEVLQERFTQAKLKHVINDEIRQNKEDKQKIEDLERRLKDQEKHNKEQNKIIFELNNKFTKTKVEKLLEDKKKRFVTDESDIQTVAFHATLDNGALQHVHVGSTIPFPHVKLNIGDGYHNDLNVFVTPKAGLYIFSTSIMGYWDNKGTVHVGIMKNGVFIAGAFVDDVSGTPEQGSVTIAVLLAVGDRVWVKHMVHDDGSLYGAGLTSFMGCLISAM